MITIDVKTALICCLFVVLIVLVVYVTIMVKHLVETVKNLNSVLQNVKVVTKIASERASQIDVIVDDVQSAVSGVADAVKGKQSFFGALSNMLRAFSSLAAILMKKQKKVNRSGKKEKES